MQFKDIYEDIEVHSIDLNKLYDELNVQLFRNLLPKIPVITSSKMKYSGGVATAIRMPDGKLIPKDIKISTRSKRKDINEVKGILAHEMIHILLYAAQLNDGHGSNFMNALKDLNEKADFKIPRYDDTREAEMSDNIKPKTFGIILVIKKDGQSAIAVCQDGLIEKYLSYFYDRFESQVTFDDWQVSFFKSNNKKLLKFPISRKYSTVKYYKLDKNLVEEIIKDAILIKKVKPVDEYTKVA